MYRVILSGLDLSLAKVFQYDNNICLLVKKRPIELPRLNFDMGDVVSLSNFFPKDIDVREGFNGDMMQTGLTGQEFAGMYGFENTEE